MPAPRLCARMLTGPLAFFLAGLVDLVAFAAGSLTHRARRRFTIVER